MKTIDSNLQTHLEGEVTTLATCWLISRQDGTLFYFTDHDQDLTFDPSFTVGGASVGSQTFKAAVGYDRSAIRNTDQLSVDNLDVAGFFSNSDITEDDLKNGLFNYAEVFVFLVNWSDLTQGILKLRRGRFGEVETTETGQFKVELRGLTQVLSQNVLELYTPECRADLGDSRCKVPIQPDLRVDSTDYALGDFVRVATDTGATGQAQYENVIYECTVAGTSDSSEPTFDTTPGNTTADNTVTWTAREAWTRHGVVDTSPTSDQVFALTSAFDSHPNDADDWFNGGVLTFESGNNDGFSMEIRDWDLSSREVTLFLTARFAVQAGDLVRLYPGCDKRRTTCRNKFVIAGSTDFANGNVANMRAEPDVPGENEVRRIADGQ